MKKWIIGLVLGLVFTGAGISYYLVTQTEEKMTKEELKEARETIKGAVSAEELKNFEDDGKNPFGETLKRTDLTDHHYQEYIHGMSHQKIKASEKWGFYEIHPDRITWLLDSLSTAEVQHANTYKGILKKWKNEDFSTIDKDHNAIWKLQNGTVGKATGLLSTQEELEYISKNK